MVLDSLLQALGEPCVRSWLGDLAADGHSAYESCDSLMMRSRRSESVIGIVVVAKSSGFEMSSLGFTGI